MRGTGSGCEVELWKYYKIFLKKIAEAEKQALADLIFSNFFR